MTDFGVISDIHGDVKSLLAVWEAMQFLGLTDRTVFNAGDTVAYGADSEQCARFVMGHSNIVSVAGNYDSNVAKFPAKNTSFEKKWGESRPEKFEAIRSASDSISSEVRSWLDSLPKLLRQEVDGSSLAMCHYSPTGDKEGLGTWTPESRLAEVANLISDSIVITGHTHTPFCKTVAGTLFINPGSVGRPFFKPTFAVLSVDENVAPRARLLSCP